MMKNFMSSEESREELEDGEKQLILIVKPILKLTVLFQMDSRFEKSKSAQAKQQTSQRVIFNLNKPAGYSSDFYGFVVA